MIDDQAEPHGFPDRYRSIKCLGTGATGAVFHAHDSILQRDVAIKVLHEGFAPSTVARFQREAQAASRLKHPYVVSVLDFGVNENSRPYLVMEHLEGIDLQSLLKEVGSLAPERTCRLFIQLCDALAHANSKGVIHRDIKPSNIIIQNNDDEEWLKIVDFGLARLSDQDQTLTAPGVTMGTPYYLNPEVISGKVADARSDIYSVGCVLFECLTGRPPFMGDNINTTLMMHVSDKMPPLQNKDNEIPSGLEQIVSKALEKDPDARFQTTDQLQAALTAEWSKFIKPDSIKVSNTLKPITDSFNYGRIFRSQSLLQVKQETMETRATNKWLVTSIICLVIVLCLIPVLTAKQDTVTDSHIDQAVESQVETKGTNLKSNPQTTEPKGEASDDESYGKKVKDALAEKNNKFRIDKGYSDDQLISLIRGTNLERLQVGERTLTNKLMSEIVSHKKLNTIKFTNVKEISADMLKGLQSLPNLSTLYMDNCDLDDTSLKLLSKCLKLKTLGVNQNPHITGSSLGFLKNHKELIRVYLGHTRVTKPHLKNFLTNKPVKLRNIEMSGLKLTDKDIRSLNLNEFQTIDVGDNPITNETVKYLASISPLLNHMNFSGCDKLTDECLVDLPANLDSIVLSETNVKNLTAISKLRKLREVSIERCPLIGYKAMDELGKMRLRKVSLKDTKVTDNGLRVLVARHPRGMDMTINLQGCPRVSAAEVERLRALRIEVHTDNKEKSYDKEF